MSTITIDRAVVLQVLEALEYAQQDRECPSTTRQAITAIRVALAQQQAEPVQEPAEVMTERDHFDFARWHCRLGELADAYYAAGGTNPARWRARAELMQHALEASSGWRVRSALAVQQRQQVEAGQETVAWLQPKTVDGYSRPDLGYETCSKDDYGAFPVHTAPPRRTMVPLTVKEIFDAFYAVKNATPISKRHGLSVLEIARLVEKASWEKNHG